MKTSKRHGTTITALAILFVLGSTFAAAAQSQGRSQSRSDPSGSAGSDPGRIILYGTPGNCPPTIACAPPREEQPRRRAKTKICDKWEIVTTATGKRIKKCLER